MIRTFYLLLFIPQMLFAEPVKGWDDILPPDLDILNTSFVIPNDEINHVHTFLEIAESITLPSEFTSLLAKSLYDPQNVDPEELMQCIDANQQSIDALENLIETDSHINLATLQQRSQNLSPLIHLSQARVIAYLISDQPKQAISYLPISHELATIFTEAAVDYDSLQLAMMAQQEFYQTCYVLSRDRALRSEDLQAIANMLEEPMGTLPIFQSLMKQNAVESIDKVYQIYQGEWEDKLSRKTNLQSKVYLQPNRTAKLYLETTLLRLQQLTLPANQRDALIPQDPPLFSSNRLGHLLWQDFAKHPKFLHADLDYIHTHQKLTQLFCALKRYQLANRSLPKTLDQLTPKYLKTLPLESYTGEQFGYSAEKKRLWSIGPDRESQEQREEQSNIGYLATDQELEPTLSLKSP